MVSEKLPNEHGARSLCLYSWKNKVEHTTCWRTANKLIIVVWRPPMPMIRLSTATAEFRPTQTDKTPQTRNWRLKPSGMLGCVVEKIIPDVSTDCIVYIFRVKLSKKYVLWIFLDCLTLKISHYDQSKRRQLLTQRQNVTFQRIHLQQRSYENFKPRKT